MNLITVIVFVQVIAVVWNITVVDFNLEVHFVSHNTSEVADHVVVCAGNYLRNGTYRDCEYLNDIVKLEANKPTNVTLSAKGIWPTHPWFLVLSFRLHRVDDSSVYLRKIEFSRIYNVTAISQYASIDLITTNYTQTGRFLVRCKKYNYGPSCNLWCPSKESGLSLTFDCSFEGKRICHPGWSGDFCNEPICEGCIFGKCLVPGHCICENGWLGKDCSKCEQRTGCRHGFCRRPGECNCYPGWEGVLCNVRTSNRGSPEKSLTLTFISVLAVIVVTISVTIGCIAWKVAFK